MMVRPPGDGPIGMKLHHGDLPGAALLNRVRASIAAALFPASIAPCSADPARVIHYPPAETLEHVVVELIDRLEHEIDQAAHVLTDWSVVQALARAAIGDVIIRIYTHRTRPWRDSILI